MMSNGEENEEERAVVINGQRYRIGKKLAEGGFSAIYVAYHARYGNVILKSINTNVRIVSLRRSIDEEHDDATSRRSAREWERLPEERPFSSDD